MKPSDYVDCMQGLSQAEAAISRMWPDADGPARSRLLEASNLLERARAKIRTASALATKADKMPPEQE